MSKQKTRLDHIREWQRKKDKEARKTWAPRRLDGTGRRDAGQAWSVHRATPHTPSIGAALATQRRQAALRDYRTATGQEPFDVPASWPSSADLATDKVLGADGEFMTISLEEFWLRGEPANDR